jgi:uncharacterized protein YecT (DUF1311 family)
MKLFTLLFVSAYFFATNAGDSTHIICTSASTTNELFQCEKQKLDSLNTKLNNIYNSAIIKVREISNNLKKKTIIKKEYGLLDSTLIKSQQKWIEYRDSYCKIYLNMDDSLSYIVCMQQLTNVRIHMLGLLFIRD